MKAVRFQGVGRQAQVTEVPKPKAGPGQVVIKVGAAGVCHSDLHLMEEDFGLSNQFTLGHENAGWVSEIGEGVQSFKGGRRSGRRRTMGLRVLHACQESMENYCENHASLNGMGGGRGFDGGMADYMLVPFDTVSRAARQFESRESGAAERRGFDSISCDQARSSFASCGHDSRRAGYWWPRAHGRAAAPRADARPNNCG